MFILFIIIILFICVCQTCMTYLIARYIVVFGIHMCTYLFVFFIIRTFKTHLPSDWADHIVVISFGINSYYI